MISRRKFIALSGLSFTSQAFASERSLNSKPAITLGQLPKFAIDDLAMCHGSEKKTQGIVETALSAGFIFFNTSTKALEVTFYNFIEISSRPWSKSDRLERPCYCRLTQYS